VLGLKHALDADHLVAVSTIVGERKGFLSSSIVGAMWGIGHTASLFIVGLCVIALRLRIPEQIAEGMEFSVALMLVFLGANVLLKLLRGGKLHTHVHTHGDHIHIHPHIHEHSHATIEGSAHHLVRLPFARWMKSVREQIGHGKRSIFIGMVHGMAGSAALMLLVLATIPSPVFGLVYILVFGIGSIGGMLLMSMLIGVPFIFSARGSERINLGLRGIAGMMSVLFGLYLAWQIGDRLFL
jgi:high-affinity nickel permease